MSRRETILQKRTADLSSYAKAPDLSEKKTINPGKEYKKHLSPIYPELTKEDIKIVGEIKWLNYKSFDYLINLQDVVDSIIMSRISPENINRLKIAIHDFETKFSEPKLVELLEILKESNVSFEIIDEAIGMLNEIIKKSGENNIFNGALNLLKEIRKTLANRSGYLTLLRKSKSFDEIRDLMPQFVSAERAHAFSTESKRDKPRGIWEPIPCGRCGCHYFESKPLHTSGLDEATREIKRCVNCIGN